MSGLSLADCTTRVPPPFFRGVLPGISRSLKAEMHDAAVLLAVRKEPLDEQRKETQ